MIFVTVGTHEQPFNRLIKEVDKLKEQGIITEQVVMQIGFSNYVPQYCSWERFIPTDQMNLYMSRARIIICHGGPATFLKALSLSKVPIVVPRQFKYHEHINNHQLDFVKFIYKHNKNIIPVYNIDDLEYAVNNYNVIIQKLNGNELKDNTKRFNIKFSELVSSLFKKGR